MIKVWMLSCLTLASVFGAQRVTETPRGSIDGVNALFTLSTLPYSDSIKVHKNGIRLTINADYTMNAQSITLLSVPSVGDILLADYDALIPSGYHMLVSKATNSCIMPGSTNKLVSLSCAGTDIQSFNAAPSSSGFVLTVKSNGQVFDLLNSATVDGTAVIQSASSGSKGQQWQPVSLDNDTFFELTNVLSNGGSCLTVSAGSIVLQTCNGAVSQKWQWQ